VFLDGNIRLSREFFAIHAIPDAFFPGLPRCTACDSACTWRIDRLLESEEKGSLMSTMAGVLFDLDGVFYVGNEPVPGAVEALEWFRQRGIPHLFLTNTTSKPRSGLVDKLRSIGIDTDESHLRTRRVQISEC